MSTIRQKYSLFPPSNPFIYRRFKVAEAAVWSTLRLDFSQDALDYREASPGVRKVIDHFSAFVLPGDGAVSTHIVEILHRYGKKNPQACWIYAAQLSSEVVHSEAYGLFIEAVYTPEEQEMLKNVADNSPYTKAKFDFLEKYMKEDVPECEMYFALSCFEGVCFSKLFALAFWIRKTGKFPGFILSNNYVSQDETRHRDDDALMNIIHGPLDQKRAYEILDEVMKIEELSDADFLSEPIEDLNKEDMLEYLKVVSDACLAVNGYKTRFNAKNRMTWVEDICLIQKPNIFEIKAASYSKWNVDEAVDYEKRIGKKKPLSLTSYDDEDF